MSSTPVGYLIRKNDFPHGVTTPDDVERLGALVNPYLSKTNALGSRGVNLSQNLDGQVLSMRLTTPATDWTDFAPSGWANAGGAYPNFGWRRDPSGGLWVRGRISGLPALGTVLVTLPAGPTATVRLPVDAAGAYGAIEIASNGQIKQVVGSIAGTLDLACAVQSANNAPGAYSCFPQSLRITDGRRPAGVVLLSARDFQPAGATTPAFAPVGVAWTYAGQGEGQPNTVTVNNIPGLALGRTYVLSFLVLFT